MGAHDRVELQAEVTGRRDALFPLVATPEGLRSWLDDAEMEARVGSAVRLTLADAVATGKVLAVDPPQHISWSFDWDAGSLRAPTVLAFDLIDHGARTHLTLRHVGFRGRQQTDQHEGVWRYWFDRLVRSATRQGERSGPDPKGPQAT